MTGTVAAPEAKNTALSWRSGWAFDFATVLLLIGAPLGLGAWYAAGRPFWSDELFGWMLVTDPLLSHMVAAWQAGADGGGIGFYLFARGWMDVFGRTEIAFRSFSAFGVGAGAALTYLATRRFFPRQTALLSVSFLWFTSPVLLWQMKQARFYGMLLAAVALAVYLAVLSLRKVSVSLLVLTFVAHTILVATHPFGALYSGCVLAGLLAVAARYRSYAPRLYLAVIGAWWPLLLSVTAMRNTAAVGKPTFWTVPPKLHEFLLAYVCSSKPVGLVVVAGALLIGASLLLERRRPSRPGAGTSPTGT